MSTSTKPPELRGDSVRKRRRRILFWGINLLALLLAIPLLKATWPLLEVIWKTRSAAAIQQNMDPENADANSLRSELQTMVDQTNPEEAEASLNQLARQLEGMGSLDQEALDTWASRLFGETSKKNVSETFDLDAAVFSRIERAQAEVDGQKVFVYLIELVDPNQNKDYRMDVSAEPDPDYERSMMTLDLIEKNPELKKIYDAFSHAMTSSVESNKDGEEEASSTKDR